MTITQSPSAPLVAVVGATGNQGGSVIKALAESDKLYRVRAFTRDATKPAAHELTKLDADVVAVSLTVDNKDAVYKAFAGADVAFIVTNFWEHMSMEREIAEGKLCIDAAKAGGVSRIVWSGLPSVSTLSGGKATHVYHYDGKAIVTAYGRQCGVPFVDVQAGFYGTNFFAFPMWLAKQDDGSFAIPWPLKPSAVVAFIDTASDYGLFVRQVLEAEVFPDGGEVVAHGEKITIEDMAKQLAEITGKKIAFKEITPEQFAANVAGSGLPPPFVAAMSDLFAFYAEFGLQKAWKDARIPGQNSPKPRTGTRSVFPIERTNFVKHFATIRTTSTFMVQNKRQHSEFALNWHSGLAQGLKLISATTER
ncbi:NAD(P)-binding protein [Mycena crocata]|nr:NAD(P)-binding protein [Mycena crocata]